MPFEKSSRVVVATAGTGYFTSPFLSGLSSDRFLHRHNRWFYPARIVRAAIRCTIAPNSRRVRWLTEAMLSFHQRNDLHQEVIEILKSILAIRLSQSNLSHPAKWLPTDKVRDEIAKRGMRELMRATGLSQHTIEAIREGKPVRRATLKRLQTALGASLGQIPAPSP